MSITPCLSFLGDRMCISRLSVEFRDSSSDTLFPTYLCYVMHCLVFSMDGIIHASTSVRTENVSVLRLSFSLSAYGILFPQFSSRCIQSSNSRAPRGCKPIQQKSPKGEARYKTALKTKREFIYRIIILFLYWLKNFKFFSQLLISQAAIFQGLLTLLKFSILISDDSVLVYFSLFVGGFGNLFQFNQ